VEFKNNFSTGLKSAYNSGFFDTSPEFCPTPNFGSFLHSLKIGNKMRPAWFKTRGSVFHKQVFATIHRLAQYHQVARGCGVAQ
jgi:hypothetical protein